MKDFSPHLKDSEERLKKNLVRQTILADIAQHFLSLDQFEEKISFTLTTIGHHTGVSRVYIFEDSPDGTTTSNTYEWCNEGVSAQKDELQGIPYEIIPSWKKILIEDGKVFSTNILELPEDLVVILEPQQIKSMLVFPLYVENKFFGSIGFDECKINKSWEKDEIELLRTIAGIISNSFERKLYQQKLTESEIRLKSAIENTETCLWDWNITNGNLFFNDFWYKMLGYDPKELESNIKGWEDLVHPDDKPRVIKDLTDHIDGNKERYVSVYRARMKSGKWKWVIDKGKVIEYDDHNKPIRAIGTIVDIDRQKQVEEELRALNITKDKLFSIIGHDLRGLIGAIMQISEMVSEKDALDEDTLYQFLHSQKLLSQNTFQLLENLLSWARLNLEQIRYNPKTISLKSIIDESMLGVAYRIKQKDLTIEADCPEHLFAIADEEMVKLVLRNLLNNAIKFTRNGCIKIKVDHPNNHVEIKITDNGVGIGKDDIQKILSDDVFHTTYGTANERGSGLGLKLCKSFIQMNKGEFYIDSVIEKGSTFTFTLPKATA